MAQVRVAHLTLKTNTELEQELAQTARAILKSVFPTIVELTEQYAGTKTLEILCSVEDLYAALHELANVDRKG